MTERTYQFKILATVRIKATNKRFAQTILTDTQRRIKDLEAVGFSPVHGTFEQKVVNVVSHPNPRDVSATAINKAEIRISNVYNLDNLLATGGFDKHGPRDVERLFDWLDTNAGPDSPYLPQTILSEFAPFTNHLAFTLNKHMSKHTRLENIEIYESAARTFSNPDFAVFVKVEAPVRMYRPDGEYSSSWSYVKPVYGFGADYESALRRAYRFVLEMREARCI